MSDPAHPSGSRPRTYRRVSPWPVLPLAAALACSSSSDEGSVDPGSDEPLSSSMADSQEFPSELLPAKLSPDLPLVAPESDLDIAVFSDIVTIQPGDDVTFCTFTDVILDEARIFGQSFGAQSPHGHHSILQYTTTAREPHTGDCGDAMDGQMLLGGTGGKEVADELYLPENFGVEVPAGAQLVINHHWINTASEPVDAQAMMLARGLERGGDTVLAGNMIMLGLGWEIPAQSSYEYSTECVFDGDVPYVLALGHMHEWGSNVRVEIERAGGDLETLLDDPWTEEAATGTADSHVYSLEDPFMIHTGDTVRLTCEWDNTTDEAIGFPREMCIFFGYTVGESYVCANGTWLTSDEAAAASMGQETISHL